MEHYYTEADAGSVLVGHYEELHRISNGYGDGTVHVYTDVTAADMAELKTRYSVEEWVHEYVACGITHIYPYDCPYDWETGELHTGKPVATLDGRYWVYSGQSLYLESGIVLFEKLD